LSPPLFLLFILFFLILLFYFYFTFIFISFYFILLFSFSILLFSFLFVCLLLFYFFNQSEKTKNNKSRVRFISTVPPSVARSLKSALSFQKRVPSHSSLHQGYLIKFPFWKLTKHLKQKQIIRERIKEA